MRLLRYLAPLLLAGVSLAQIIPGGNGSGPQSSIVGSIQTATGGAIKNGTLTFTLSQPAIVSGTATVATQTSSCYTSRQGNIVGMPDPVVAPVTSTNTASGALPAGTYYVTFYYANAGGTSAQSPETVVSLTSTGTINVNAPVLQPSAALGYGIAIGTTSGGEFVQGSVTGWTQYHQTSALSTSIAPPTSNSSSCALYFSDVLIPTGTNYTVNLINQAGSQVAGYPQTWCTYGGATGVINVSQGAPTGNCGTNGVFYPTPLLSVAPSNVTVQSINTALSISGALTVAQGATFGGPLVASGLDSVIFADQMTCGSVCSDDGAKIAAAINACVGSCNTVDARALTGLTAADTILVNRSIKLLMPPGVFLLSGNPGVQLAAVGASLDGTGPGTSVLVTTSPTADVVQANGLLWNVANLGFRASGARTAGAGLRVKGGIGHAEHLRFDKTYDGVQITDNAGSGQFEDIQFGSGLAIGGNWNCAIEVGGVAVGTVTSITFNKPFISTDAPFADAAICIYDGSDTIYFVGANIGHVNGIPARAVHIGRKVAGSFPQWVKFIGGNFEADGSVTNVFIDEARDVEFVNATIQSGSRGIWAKTSCIACIVIGGNISIFQQEAVRIDDGIGFKILGANIGDASQQANNTYDSVHVSANVSDFHIEGVTFSQIQPSAPANLARYNVYIEAGSSNRYSVTTNDFGQNVSGGFFDGGTGTQKVLLNQNTTVPVYLPNLVGGYNGAAVAGQGLPPILGVTSQKAEIAADTNVLTVTPPASAGSYRVCFALSLSAANAATLGWTATWKDSNGNAQSPTNLSLFQSGTAAPGLTFVTSATGNYSACQNIDIDNSATSIVIKLTFTGTSFAGKASAWVERYI